MPLPKIFNPTPIVVPGQPEQIIPAVPTQTYPDSFLISMELSPFTDGVQSLTVKFRPFNYAQGSIYPDDTKDSYLFIDNVWVEAARAPVFAQIMGGIVQVASMEYQEWAIKTAITNTTDPTALAQLEVELAEIQNALGMNVPTPPGPYDNEAPINVPTFDFKAKNAKNGVVFKNGSWEIIK